MGLTEFPVLQPKAPCPSEFRVRQGAPARLAPTCDHEYDGMSGRQRTPVEAIAACTMAAPAWRVAVAFGEVAPCASEHATCPTPQSRALDARRAALLPWPEGEIWQGVWT